MRGVLKGVEHHLDHLHVHAAEQRAETAQRAAEAWQAREAERLAAPALREPEHDRGETDSTAV